LKRQPISLQRSVIFVANEFPTKYPRSVGALYLCPTNSRPPRQQETETINEYIVETQDLASFLLSASSPEHCRRRKFLVLVEEEVAAGDRNYYKLATFQPSPDDGEGDINIIPYSKTTFPNNPNILMIENFLISSFSLSCKENEAKESSFSRCVTFF